MWLNIRQKQKIVCFTFLRGSQSASLQKRDYLHSVNMCWKGVVDGERDKRITLSYHSMWSTAPDMATPQHNPHLRDLRKKPCSHALLNTYTYGYNSGDILWPTTYRAGAHSSICKPLTDLGLWPSACHIAERKLTWSHDQVNTCTIWAYIICSMFCVQSEAAAKAQFIQLRVVQSCLGWMMPNGRWGPHSLRGYGPSPRIWPGGTEALKPTLYQGPPQHALWLKQRKFGRFNK